MASSAAPALTLRRLAPPGGSRLNSATCPLCSRQLTKGGTGCPTLSCIAPRSTSPGSSNGATCPGYRPLRKSAKAFVPDAPRVEGGWRLSPFRAPPVLRFRSCWTEGGWGDLVAPPALTGGCTRGEPRGHRGDSGPGVGLARASQGGTCASYGVRLKLLYHPIEEPKAARERRLAKAQRKARQQRADKAGRRPRPNPKEELREGPPPPARRRKESHSEAAIGKTGCGDAAKEQYQACG